MTKEKDTGTSKENFRMDDSMSSWEDMSVGRIFWNGLFKQLTDLSSLSRLIRYQPVKIRSDQKDILNCSIDDSTEELNCTLAGILQKGRGNFYT